MSASEGQWRGKDKRKRKGREDFILYHFCISARQQAISAFHNGRREEENACSSDTIRPFDGQGDVVAWLTKVKLVARLQHITDLASLIPLYLEGDALALYMEMHETEMTDAEMIESMLLKAFMDGPFVAYGKLIKSKWTGESIDVHAKNIR